MIGPVTVVLVNYNGGAHLLDCLEALQQQAFKHDVLIVDNASSDASARRAHIEFPNHRVLPLRRNVGFSRAVNLAAARLSEPDGIMVTLNPDTVPRHDFLEHLCQPLSADPTIGATAGTLVFASDPSIIASAGIAMHRNGVALDARLGEHWSPSAPAPVFGASGGAAAYRLSAFRDAGGFPDSFFLYLEDADLAWRLRLRDWQAVAAPGAVATHVYSASAVEGSPLKRRLLARNRLWLLARCLPTAMWKRDGISIIGFDIAAASYALLSRDGAALKGRLQGLAGLPLRLNERGMIQSRARVRPDEVDEWLLPPVSPVTLRRLRSLTRKLSTGPSN